MMIGKANTNPAGMLFKFSTITISRKKRHRNINRAALAHSLPNNIDRFCPRIRESFSKTPNFAISTEFSSIEEKLRYINYKNIFYRRYIFMRKKMHERREKILSCAEAFRPSQSQ